MKHQIYCEAAPFLPRAGAVSLPMFYLTTVVAGDTRSISVFTSAGTTRS